jgi:hypothetical protein
LEATAEADAYATTLREAALFCIEAARGEAPAKVETPQSTEPKSEKAEREKPESKKPAAHVA